MALQGEGARIWHCKLHAYIIPPVTSVSMVAVARRFHTLSTLRQRSRLGK